MNYLVFDTETTGFPHKDKPADYPGQARIVQLACMLLDGKFNERAVFKTLIKPAGWFIQPGAQAAHGISLEECEQYGIPIKDAIATFNQMQNMCDVKVAHNIKFDNQMLMIEQTLVADVPVPVDEFCTMNATTDICCIVGKMPGKYKWPKLSEAYRYLFEEELVGAHDALVDVRACARIYKRLQLAPAP